MFPLPTSGPRQSEKREPVPARTCDRNRDRAERGVLLVLKTEPLRKDFNQNCPPSPFPAEHGSWQRQPTILLPVPSRRLHCLAADVKKVSRRDLPQVGILRDLVRARTCPLREITFRQCLQPPGNPPEQMFPMSRSRLLLKHLAKLLPQGCQTRPAQLLNFHQYHVIHRCVFLSVTVNHSHMNALCDPTSKCILQNVQTNEKRRQDKPGGSRHKVLLEGRHDLIGQVAKSRIEVRSPDRRLYYV